MQARLDRALGDTEQRRDLRLAEPVHVAQHQHRAVLGRKVGERGANVYRVGQVDIRSRPVDGLRHNVAGAGLTHRFPHGDAAHPATHRGRLPKVSKVSQHGDERLLHRVVAPIERDGPADPPDVRGEGAHERVHGHRIPPLGRANEVVHITRRRRHPEKVPRQIWNLEHRPLPLRGMTTINVVGGGLAGMIAAITASENGATVELYEAHEELGGRARSLPGPWVANWGPHALYNDGPLWAWLAERDLLPPVVGPSVHGLFFRYNAARRTTPPACMVRSIGVLRARSVPDQLTFRDWAGERYGDEAARRWAAAAGVATFFHDPGSLAASFVAERLRRAFALPPAARFPVGGWSAIVDRLEGRMRALGVRINTGVTVDRLPAAPRSRRACPARGAAPARRRLGPVARGSDRTPRPGRAITPR